MGRNIDSHGSTPERKSQQVLREQGTLKINSNRSVRAFCLPPSPIPQTWSRNNSERMGLCQPPSYCLSAQTCPFILCLWCWATLCRPPFCSDACSPLAAADQDAEGGLGGWRSRGRYSSLRLSQTACLQAVPVRAAAASFLHPVSGSSFQSSSQSHVRFLQKRAGPGSWHPRLHPEAALPAGQHPLSRVWVPPPRLISLNSETPAPAGPRFLLGNRTPGLSSEVLET